MLRSKGPIFDHQARHLAKISLVARDENRIVRQCDCRDFLIARADAQTQGAKQLKLILGSLVKRRDRELLHKSQRFQEQRITLNARRTVTSLSNLCETTAESFFDDDCWQSDDPRSLHQHMLPNK